MRLQCTVCNMARLHMQVLVTAFTVVPSRSGAVRTFEQRAVLEQFNPRCVAVSLSGYIFFGSSVAISDKVMEVRQSHGVPQATAFLIRLRLIQLQPGPQGR